MIPTLLAAALSCPLADPPEIGPGGLSGAIARVVRLQNHREAIDYARQGQIATLSLAAAPVAPSTPPTP